MTLKRNINTRELDKFTECPSGEVAVRNYICGGSAAMTPSGLHTAGKVTEISVSSAVWTALPAAPLVGRNAMGLQNQSDIDIKINYDNAAVGYVGVIVPAGAERFWDVTDEIVIYAKAASGSPVVVIEEIS